VKRFGIQIAVALSVTAPAALSAELRSSPTLGMAEGRCRAGEPGPALLINVVGLKDRGGTMKAELYPANQDDFLQDDNILISAGKTFRRVVIDIPKSGNVQLCLRVPSPGTFALSLLHDRDGNRKFGLSTDGVGFGSNPQSLGPTKPRVAVALVRAGGGITPVNVRMMYRRGLFSFGPLK
jgi:uncharacterized protein (DUF2141 family)